MLDQLYFIFVNLFILEASEIVQIDNLVLSIAIQTIRFEMF